MAIDFGRAARGIATGYISEAVRDRRQADQEKYENLQYAKRQYFEVDKPAFMKQEEVRENNYNLISGTLSPVIANYGDALGVTANNASTTLFMRQVGDLSKEDQYKIESSFIDRKKGRIKSFDERTAETRDLLSTMPGGPGSMNMMNYFFPNEGEDPSEIGIGQEQTAETMSAQTAAESDIPMMPIKSVMQIEGSAKNVYNFDEHRVPRNNASSFFEGFFVNDLRQPSISFSQGTPQFVLMNELLKGYDEAEKAGFNKGKYEYARLKYIDQELKREGISGFPTGFPETKQETVEQPAEQIKDSKATVGDGTKFDAPDVSKIGVKEGINEKSRQVIDGKVVSYNDASDAINKLREVISRISNSNILSDDQKEKNIDIARERTRQKIIEMGLNPDNFNL